MHVHEAFERVGIGVSLFREGRDGDVHHVKDFPSSAASVGIHPFLAWTSDPALNSLHHVLKNFICGIFTGYWE